MSSGCSTMVIACLVILGITLGRGVHGYGNGAAHPACTHMHVAHGEYQRGPSPYSISLPDSPTKYSAANQVKRKWCKWVNSRKFQSIIVH